MTLTFTPETIAENRRKAVEHLRTTKLPQGRHDLYNARMGCYCALGHMGLAIGIDAKLYAELHEGTQPYDQIEKALGLNFPGAQVIWRMNDTQHKTLREIGDFLAAKWGIA